MSLEQHLADNTAALKELTAFLKSSASGSAVAASAGKGATAAGKAEGTKTDDKPATATRARRSTTKAPTAKDVEKVATKFLEDAEKDEDEYADRRQFIKDLAAQYEIPRLTAAKEGDFQAIIDRLGKYEAEGADAGGDDQGEDDSGI